MLLHVTARVCLENFSVFSFDNVPPNIQNIFSQSQMQPYEGME